MMHPNLIFFTVVFGYKELQFPETFSIETSIFLKNSIIILTVIALNWFNALDKICIPYIENKSIF